ncbi:hypothetical protein CRE_14693 [Caenorhabditis remanei]|uniref:Uncharacterized protein n=1 Tax=Caenorhabditis remanei TaxID=31234 RepID=E3M9M1_CAERE|nr:hypothetical protein CRE_14693 [Caenorhabditis remanei]
MFYTVLQKTPAVQLLAVLAKSDSMTDTFVHSIGSNSLTPFFVENVQSLKIAASKVMNAFLNGFLAKCSQKGNKMDGEEDYRILFSNFLQELLVAINSSEWPASEMILSALGLLLVENFSLRFSAAYRNFCVSRY